MMFKFLYWLGVFSLVGPFCLAENFSILDANESQTGLVQTDVVIAEKIDKLAKNLDLGLAGAKSSNESNRTQLGIRNQLSWAEGGNFSYKPALDLRLHLPNLEKKWALKFSTYDNEAEGRGVNRNRLKTSPIAQNYGGGVELVQKLGQVEAQFEPRLEFRGPLQLSYILRLKSSATAGDMTLIPEAQFFVTSDNGAGQFFGVDTNFDLFGFFILTLVNEEQYLDKENVFSTNHGVRLTHDYSGVLSQNLSCILESSSRPNFHLDRYTVATSVTYKIYRNILHVTFMPYLAFLRVLDYRGSPGANLEINLIF